MSGNCPPTAARRKVRDVRSLALSSATPENRPAISIVIAVHNGERFLSDAVESILSQTVERWELIVVDDGSTDSSPQILERYAQRDPRVVIQRGPRRGRAAALNHGISLARSPLIARLDADDVALPERLERQQRFLAEHEQVAVLGGAVIFADDAAVPFAEVRQPLSDPEIRAAFPYTTPLAHPAVMFRKEAFLGAGGYRTIFRVAEDLDLWLRVSEQHQLANLPDPVVVYRVHADQDSVRKVELQSLEALAARFAARARARGSPDPLAEVQTIDRLVVVGMGIGELEITSAVVHDMTWLARTLGRAGYREVADRLFDVATVRARSESGSAALIAEVHRARAHRLAEQGQRLRQRVELARARFAQVWPRTHGDARRP